MTEHRPDDPQLVDFDLLKYMNGQPSFWDDVSKLNMRLTANLHSDNDSLDEALEKAALAQFHTRYFGSMVERAVFLVTMLDDDTDADTPPTLVATQAKFLGCTTEFCVSDEVVDHGTKTAIVQDLGTRMVAFVFATEAGPCTFPINKDYIKSLHIRTERGLDEEPTLADRIKNLSRHVRHLSHTDTFLAADFQTQGNKSLSSIEQARTFISELGDIKEADSLVFFRDSEGRDTMFRADQVLLTFPDMAGRKTPFRSSDEYDYGGEFGLLVSNTSSDEVEMVRASDLISIVKDKEPDLHNTPIDGLHDLFGTEAIARAIAFYETKLNAAKTVTEFTRIAAQADATLESIIPPHVLGMGIYAEGKLYRDIDILSEALPRSILHDETICANAAFQGFGVNLIDGRWRITLALGVYRDGKSTEKATADDETYSATDAIVPDRDESSHDEESDDEDVPAHLVFVVPNRDYLDGLWFEEAVKEITPQDVIDNFRACEEQMQALVASPSFLAADRQTQNAMIEERLEDTGDLLDAYLTQKTNGIQYEFDCDASYYRRVKLSDANAPTQTIARKPLLSGDNHTLSGGKVRIAVPETHDDSLVPFRSLDDFPLSQGRPMLIVDNHHKKACYYVSLSDVSALIPGEPDEA